MQQQTKALLRNILIAPLVIAVRVPVGINYWISKKFVDLVEKHQHMLPSFEAVKK